MYTGHVDKARGQDRGWEVGMTGVGKTGGGGGMETTVLNHQ